MCSLFVWLSLASSQTITTSRDLLFITMVPSRDSSYVSKDWLDMMEKESLIFENKMNQIIFAINMFVYMYVFVMDRHDTSTGGYCGFWIFFELKIEEVPSMENEICGIKCLIFNILKSKYHLRSNFLKVKKIRLLADMIWALHVRLKNGSLVCGIKEVDSASCRTREVFEVFSLLQVSSSLRCFGMDHFEHLSWTGKYVLLQVPLHRNIHGLRVILRLFLYREVRQLLPDSHWITTLLSMSQQEDSLLLPEMK